jgi:DNA polymerase-3 subunit alpha
LAKVLDDATRVGIPVLPPDIHRSGPRFTLEPTAEGAPQLRYGLGAVKGLGETGLVALHAARAGGAFANLGDLATRTGLDKGTIEALVASGALDGLVLRRDLAAAHLRAWQEAQTAQTKAHTAACKALQKAADRAWVADQKLRAAAKAKAAKTVQASLFAPPPAPEVPAEPPSPVALPEAPPPIRFEAIVPEVPREKRWTWLDRLAREQKAIGVVLSGSALWRWGDLAEGLSTHRIGELASVPPRVPVALCARVRAVHEHRTKTGSTIGFVTITDATGSTEVTVFSSTWHASKAALKPGTGVLVRGTLDRAGPTGVLIAGSIEDLDAVRARGTRLLRLGRSGTALGVDPADLDAVLLLHPGLCPVRVNGTLLPAWKTTLETRLVSPDGALFDDLERTFGEPGTARAIV